MTPRRLYLARTAGEKNATTGLPLERKKRWCGGCLKTHRMVIILLWSSRAAAAATARAPRGLMPLMVVVTDQLIVIRWL